MVDGVQAEKELSEVNLQLESLHERLEEADGLSSAQVRTASTRPHVTDVTTIIIVIRIVTVVFHL